MNYQLLARICDSVICDATSLDVEQVAKNEKAAKKLIRQTFLI